MQYPDNPTDWYFWTNRSMGYNQEDIAEKYAKYSSDPDKPLEDPNYFCRTDERHITGYKHYQVNRFSAVYICISKMGEANHIILGNADLTRKDFPEKWKELVSAAKERVDRLNSLSAALELAEGGSCAECGGNCAEGDYLCEKCRNE